MIGGMPRFSFLFLGVLVLSEVVYARPGPATFADADRTARVIRTTSALVYIDAGSEQGTHLGQVFVVLHEADGGFLQVADVRVIRLYPAFAITELLHVENGKSVQVLDSVVPLIAWEQRSQPVGPRLTGGKYGVVEKPGRILVYVVGGGEWNRTGDGLEWRNGQLAAASQGGGATLGIRVCTDLRRPWRSSLTTRAGFGQDAGSWSTELDLHWAPLGWNARGPYVGGGLGVQHLWWDAPSSAPESTTEPTGQIVAGLNVPGRWHLLLEVGYQRVAHWHHVLDASHVRTYIGVGRPL